MPWSTLIIFTVIPGGWNRKLSMLYIKIMLFNTLFRQTGDSAISLLLDQWLPNVDENYFWYLSSADA